MENKSHWFKIRVTPDEKKLIEDKAITAGVTMSELIRVLLRDAKIFGRYDRMISGQLKRIGTNLNQLVRHVNAGLPIKNEIADAIRRVVLALEAELKR